MSVMTRITTAIERRVAPAANMIAGQKHVQVIQSSFLTLIPFFTIGSFALIIISPAADFSKLDAGFGRSFFEGWQSMATFLTPTLGPIYTITIGSISLYVVAGLAFYLGRHHKMQTFIPVAIAIAAFLLMVGTDADWMLNTQYFAGTGLFTAIIVTIAVFELYRFLYSRRVGRIELSGSGVPPALTESLASLVPILIILVVFSTISSVTQWLTGAPFPELVTIVLAPLVSSVDTVWAVLLLSVLVMVLWWFGIHDTVITGPLSPFLLSNLTANTTAFAAGTAAVALPFVFTSPFWWTFMAIGGSGATLGLAFLALRSKSKHIRTVGRLSAVPALFNINEPLIFGLPLMYNPVLFFPFVFTMAINGIVTFGLMDLGFIARTMADPGWNMIAPIGALISTLDIKAMLLVLGLIVLDALIYLPFFKVFERQKLAEEHSEADAAQLAVGDDTAPGAPEPATGR